MSSGKHPMAAFLLSSARILYLSVRYARPMRVDYRTGDAWLDSELQVKGTPLSGVTLGRFATMDSLRSTPNEQR